MKKSDDDAVVSDLNHHMSFRDIQDNPAGFM